MADEQGGRSWVTILVLGIGFILYQMPIVDALRDKFQVQPAIRKAIELKQHGFREGAEDVLLAQVEANPKNPALLWELGNYYDFSDRPVVAALYFRALALTGRTNQLGDVERQVAERWQRPESPARTRLEQDILRVEAEFERFEHDYHVNVIEHPADLSRVLEEGSASKAALSGAGYIPPKFPTACGPERPRCGYAFRVGSGRLWDAVRYRELRFTDARGGPSCCTLKLSDDDLRWIVAAESDLLTTDSEFVGGALASDTESGRRAQLAYASRILLKQELMLDFVEHADTYYPEEPWTAWRWIRAIGSFALGIVLIIYLNELLDGLAQRRRQASSGAADRLRTTVLAAPPSWKRKSWQVLCVLMAAVLAWQAFMLFRHSQDQTMGMVEALDVLGRDHHYVPIPLPGNGLRFGAALFLAIAALLCVNQSWPWRLGGPGVLDRFLMRASGRNGRNGLALACLFAFVFLASATVLAVRVRFISDPEAAAAAFAQVEAEPRVNGGFIEGISREDGQLVLASFMPDTLRAFDKGGVSIGAVGPKYQVPVPGFLPLLMLALVLAGIAARKIAISPAFVVVASLYAYQMLWFVSAEKGVVGKGTGLPDPGWWQVALALLLAQLALLRAAFGRIADQRLTAQRRSGWLVLAFVPGIAVLSWYIRSSGAALLAPGVLWICAYLSLACACWVALAWRLYRGEDVP